VKTYLHWSERVEVIRERDRKAQETINYLRKHFIEIKRQKKRILFFFEKLTKITNNPNKH
jgi:hypothetical protein